MLSTVSHTYVCLKRTNIFKGKKAIIYLVNCLFSLVWYRSMKNRKISKEGLSVLNEDDKELAELRGLEAGVGLANACYAVQYVTPAIFLDHTG